MFKAAMNNLDTLHNADYLPKMRLFLENGILIMFYRF